MPRTNAFHVLFCPHGFREGVIAGFTKRYGLNRLVYAEHHDSISTAIGRETRFIHWPRAWKVRLIVASNPTWADLYEQFT